MLILYLGQYDRNAIISKVSVHSAVSTSTRYWNTLPLSLGISLRTTSNLIFLPTVAESLILWLKISLDEYLLNFCSFFWVCFSHSRLLCRRKLFSGLLLYWFDSVCCRVLFVHLVEFFKEKRQKNKKYFFYISSAFKSVEWLSRRKKRC